ncbi:hypothetical protein DL98DRAFT_536394 [Cadophora sp. DSE1049]|nr:hypothetical protein DL98DRAFT_536394 [Cadophora sp. DSE1049]
MTSTEGNSTPLDQDSPLDLQSQFSTHGNNDPSSEPSQDSSTKALGLPIANLWDESNLPTASAILEIIRSVCDCATNDYNEVISMGPPHRLDEVSPHEADGQSTKDLVPSQEIRDHSGPKTSLIRTETLGTPSTISNPADERIENLANALNFYNAISTTRIFTITLIMPSRHSGPNMPSALRPSYLSPYDPRQHRHCKVGTNFYFVTRASTLGRIIRNGKPTYWVVVMEIQHGLLFALKSDFISAEEIIDVDFEDDSLSDHVVGVGLLELDDTPWKAALLGDTILLAEESAATDVQCTMLDVVDWDSIEVHQ